MILRYMSKQTFRSSLLPYSGSAAGDFGGSFEGSGFFSGSSLSGFEGGGREGLSPFAEGSFGGGSLGFSGFGSELVD